MDFKNLVKKFSHSEILEECKIQGWTLPSSKDIKKNSGYAEVWVSDPVELDEDRLTHAMVYSYDEDKLYTANKMTLQNVTVMYNKCVCPHCGGDL